ncbi:MAG: dienelactone hydrolase family protein [Haloechinothrix sp.]
MTDTRTDAVPHPDGGRLSLTYAEPDGVVRGGIVVLHETDGVTDGVRLLVLSLAAEGWLAVAPHFGEEFAEEPAETSHAQAVATKARITGQAVLAATDTAIRWLLTRGVLPDLLGVMGFDLGGSAAMVVATSRPLGAAVSVGGLRVSEDDDLPDLVDIAGTLTCPWLGIYGDSGDEADAREVERLREASARAEAAAEVVRYPGAHHRFDNHPDVAFEAWQRTLNWFDAHLR